LVATHVLLRVIGFARRDPEFRALVLVAVAFLLSGTLFYHQVEGWRWLDSLYYCLITLATVGYGDFTPKTDLGKIFTMFYLVLGIGLFVTLVTRVADALEQARSEESARRQRRHTGRQAAPDTPHEPPV
jgi:hypothetical protein